MLLYLAPEADQPLVAPAAAAAPAAARLAAVGAGVDVAVAAAADGGVLIWREQACWW